MHFLAIAIRKTSAKRLAYEVNTYLLDEDRDFRQNAVSYVKWRFRSASKALCTQLGDSIAVRRRMLLDKRHHGVNLATRRTTNRGKVLHEGPQPGTRGTQGTLVVPQARPVGQTGPPIRQGTEASIPTSQSAVLRRISQISRPTLVSERRASSSPTGSSFEYPEPPKCIDGDQYVSCPYCFMGISSEKLRVGGTFWRSVQSQYRCQACSANSLLSVVTSTKTSSHTSVSSRTVLRH